MSKFSKCLVITLFVTAVCTSGAFATDNATAPRITIMLGTLTSDANPCTTDPCLPGIIMEITRLRGPTYILTINGNWIWESFFEWNGIRFDEKDVVLLIGEKNYNEVEIKYIFKLWKKR